MTEDEIGQRVREVIAVRLNREIGQITDEARLEDDLHADSLDKAEILMTLEDEFGLDADDDAGRIKTVGDAVAYVKALLEKGS